MPERYEPAAFEAKWRARWAEADLFKTREEAGRKKFYSLDFFPYPSGAGLSVGHCRNYVPGDVLARFKFMQGYNVLHPMGFDAFGLPAENAAIKEKSHPAIMIDRFAGRYIDQMNLVGISYDWSRSFKSSDPTYYKWTQWIFEKLYERGLAYRANAEVNWCPKDKTALANEEVVAGRCERCGTEVVKKAIPQWFFKITDYGQRLIDDLETIDWPEGVKALQRNWIGRSEGVEFEMKVSFSAGTGSVADELQALKEEVAEEAISVPELAERRINEIEAKMFDRARSIDPSIMRENPNLEVVEKTLKFRVFTTRVDTIYGMTFCVLAPEHPLVTQIAKRVDADRVQAIQAYQDQAKRKSDAERTAETKDKTGVFTGAYAINPMNGKRVPIWIADYVLANYGTGAIMAVPAHDERDFAFAKKYDLEILAVIRPTAEFLEAAGVTEEGYVAKVREIEPVFVSKDSVMINSGDHNGLSYAEGTRQIGEWMEHEEIGERKVQYKLRDWLISRQRYWGCPIPVIHTKDGEVQLVPEDCLPVYLPDVESYEPSDDGTSPLAQIDDFVNTTDRDGRLGRRETDTMGGFACSSWYFLRFCDPYNEEKAWDPEKIAYWMPVDCYIGGVEHAVMHLLYARFWMKVFYDMGLVPMSEPFARLKNQGQVLAMTPYRYPRPDETLDPGEDGILISFEEAKNMPDDQKFYRWARMSKSKGNVVTPEEAVESYGADALRMFELFVAPFDADVNWSNEGMSGMVRFLSRVCRFVHDHQDIYDRDWLNKIGLTPSTPAALEIRRATHKAIAKASEDIERFAFNTYVSALMIYVNALSDASKNRATWGEAETLAISEAIDSLILMLSPGAPHTSDELWESIGRPGFTYHEPWPSFDPSLTVDDTVTIAVQVNGKLRDTLEASASADQAEMEAMARASDKVRTYTEGKRVVKVIIVPKKLVNIVVAEI